MGDLNSGDDFDAALIEAILADADIPGEINKKDEENKKANPSFLTDILNTEKDIVLGKHKPPNVKKKRLSASKVENKNEKKDSLIHKGDTDSSEDEDNKYFEERTYTDYGRSIKKMLDNKPARNSTDLTALLRDESKPSTSTSKKTETKPPEPEKPKPKPKPTELPKFGSQKTDVLCDPIFSMRIVNPLVSSAILKERMIGRTAVPTLKIKNFVSGRDLKDINWVTGGAVVGKFIKTSQKGNQYCLWSISDLLGDIKIVSVFLFGSAYKEYWKTGLGTVVGILNPGVIDNKENKSEVTLKVENSQKIMVLGQSKDYGICKSKKKNGEDCTSVVNLSRCEHCVYHVKQAYNSASRRSDLQSSFVGKGLNNLSTLRNKVLGKNEVFYAGKAFTAIPAKKSQKQTQKDEDRLKKLSETQPRKSEKAKEKDDEILKRLSGSTPVKSVEKSGPPGLGAGRFSGAIKNQEASSGPSGLPTGKFPGAREILSGVTGLPTGAREISSGPSGLPTAKLPSTGGNREISVPSALASQPILKPKTPVRSKEIDLDFPISRKEKSSAKLNALKFVRQNGPIKKQEDSDKKKKKSPEQIQSLKRRLEMEEEKKETEAKKPKTGENTPAEKTGKDLLKEKMERCGITKEFLDLMKAPPQNEDLLKVGESEEREKYFNKLEIREKMEEKMLSTFKIECKAVRCLKCNYKSFSASDLCKSEKHPLKVVNAIKRFWKCGDCGARTVCLELVPLHSCKVCGSSKWEKTSMMRERKDPNLVREGLSIRGNEEKFIGAVVRNANLNLVMADDGL